MLALFKFIDIIFNVCFHCNFVILYLQLKEGKKPQALQVTHFIDLKEFNVTRLCKAGCLPAKCTFRHPVF